MNIHYVMCLLCLLTTSCLNLYGQAKKTGTALIFCEDSCEIVVDGIDSLSIIGNQPVPLELSGGQHLIQNRSFGGVQIVEIESGKQIIVNLKSQLTENEAIAKEVNQEVLRLADLSINIPGGLTLGAYALAEMDYETNGMPFFPYYFQKGDEVTINISRLTKKGTMTLEVYSYPEGEKVYSHYRFDSLENEKISIHRDGIYVIEIGTNHMFDRKVKYTIDRKLSESQDSVVSSRVERRTKYELITVQSPTIYWVNSTSNEYWKGGSSRITIPVNLPANTVEWYYVFTASRSDEQTKKVTNDFNLAGKLTTYLLGLPGPIVDAGFTLIGSPPGSDYCDVFLTNHENARYFKQGLRFNYWNDGSRENVMSGSIKVVTDHGQALQLGFKNRNTYHGISVGVEVVALVSQDYYAQVDSP